MFMDNQYAMLIIDAQIDFTSPEGTLFVPGADNDMKRLANWIKNNKQKIDHIAITLDNHPVNDISHPSFWQDKNGNHPAPFTPISLQEINEGKWIPRFNAEEAIAYVEKLESQGEFSHFIWPFHCLIGSKGAALNEDLMEAVTEWTLEGNYYQAVTKGTYPLTEHFGIFRANVPVADRPETQLNKTLINTLQSYENVILAGEAKSHCVANSLKQAMEEAPSLAQKFIIVEDCMSDVPNLGFLGDPIYEKAKKMGIRFAKSSDLVL
jgi:nicotinamidase/pyrazinamidase